VSKAFTKEGLAYAMARINIRYKTLAKMLPRKWGEDGHGLGEPAPALEPPRNGDNAKNMGNAVVLENCAPSRRCRKACSALAICAGNSSWHARLFRTASRTAGSLAGVGLMFPSGRDQDVSVTRRGPISLPAQKLLSAKMIVRTCRRIRLCARSATCRLMQQIWSLLDAFTRRLPPAIYRHRASVQV
jgi:hypothetical protein